MVKETLTYDIAKQDATAYIRWLQSKHKNAESVDSWFWKLLPLAVVCWLLFGHVIGIVMSVITAASLVHYIVRMIKFSKQVDDVFDNAEFNICKEKLVSITEETIYEPHGVGKRRQNYRVVTMFNFPVGTWRVQPGDYYTWLKELKMSAQGIENSSLQGEEFWVVTLVGSGEICAVYNTKFFEYVAE